MVGPAERQVILPGATLGVMGGGQLGAMFAMAAKRMGYRVEVFSDVADCPAAYHCDRVHVGSYDDPAALVAMARGLDVLTFEFENVSAEPLRALAGVVPVRPAPEVLFTTQDRGREKAFLVREGFACAPHRLVRVRGHALTVMVRPADPEFRRRVAAPGSFAPDPQRGPGVARSRGAETVLDRGSAVRLRPLRIGIGSRGRRTIEDRCPDDAAHARTVARTRQTRAREKEFA